MFVRCCDICLEDRQVATHSSLVHERDQSEVATVAERRGVLVLRYSA